MKNKLIVPIGISAGVVLGVWGVATIAYFVVSFFTPILGEDATILIVGSILSFVVLAAFLYFIMEH